MMSQFITLLITFALCGFIVTFFVKGRSIFTLKFLVSLSIFILVVAGIAFGAVYQSLRSRNAYYDVIHLIDASDDFDLMIEESEEGNYLVDRNTTKEVSFFSHYDLDESFELNSYPVYLKEYSDYYVLILSFDNEKEFLYDRFLIGDYELSTSDKLYVIEKSTGYVFDTREYDLISYEIDLNSFQYTSEAFFFNIYLPFENEIGFIYYWNITEDYYIESPRMNYYSNILMSGEGEFLHYHTEQDPSSIVSFKVVDDYFYLIDTYDRVYSGTFYQDEYGLDFISNEFLSDEPFALEGFIRISDEGIYYLDQDLNIKKLNINSGLGIFVKEIASKDEFFTTSLEE